LEVHSKYIFKILIVAVVVVLDAVVMEKKRAKKRMAGFRRSFPVIYSHCQGRQLWRQLRLETLTRGAVLQG
jgi:hypothetical protein